MLIPLLAPAGLVLLGIGAACLLMPVLATVPIEVGLFGGALSLAVFLIWGVVDAVHAQRLARTVTVSMSGPHRTRFGIQSTRHLLASAKVVPRPASVSLRLVPLEGIKLESESLVVHLSPRLLESSIECAFVPLKRGDFSWDQAWYRISLRLSVLTFQGKLPLGGQTAIEVLPNPAAFDRNEEFASRRSVQIGSRRYLMGIRGREFDGLKRYQPGDDTRLLDWKRSARGRGLVLKTYRPETHQRIAIALDCGRRMTTSVGEYLQLDLAVDAVARLVRTAVDEGDDVGFFAFDDRIRASLKVSKGRRQEELISQHLKKLEASPLESDYSLLVDWVASQNRRSLLILLTSISNPASMSLIVDALAPLKKKHLIIMVAVADRGLTTLAESPPESLDDAFVVAAGEEQLSEIRRALTVLQRGGIESVYADPLELGEELREAYMRSKASGQL